jgi:hypothetical protein
MYFKIQITPSAPDCRLVMESRNGRRQAIMTSSNRFPVDDAPAELARIEITLKHYRSRLSIVNKMIGQMKELEDLGDLAPGADAANCRHLRRRAGNTVSSEG